MKKMINGIGKRMLAAALVCTMLLSGAGMNVQAKSADDVYSVAGQLKEGGHSEEILLDSSAGASVVTATTSTKVARTGKYKSALSGNSLKIYKALASKNWKKSSSVSITFSETYNNSDAGKRRLSKDILKGYWAYLRDYADVYWINACGYRYWWNYNQRIYKLEISPKKYYKGILNEDKAVQKELKKAVSKIKSTRKSSSKLHTLMAIYDYVCKLTTYGHEYEVVPYEHTINGALLSKYNHTGVCESYAKVIKLLCDEFDIPCMLVEGDNHMWNYVKLSGKWYMIDATWDDRVSYTSTTYFLLGQGGLTTHNPTNVHSTYDGVKAGIPVPKLSKSSYNWR